MVERGVYKEDKLMYTVLVVMLKYFCQTVVALGVLRNYALKLLSVLKTYKRTTNEQSFSLLQQLIHPAGLMLECLAH